MNTKIASGFIALVIVGFIVAPARGDDTKPYPPTESPIHMTHLPVPDEFHTSQKQAILTPVLLDMAYDHTPAKAPEMPVSDEYRGILAGGERDDSDAGLDGRGRRY